MVITTVRGSFRKIIWQGGLEGGAREAIYSSRIMEMTQQMTSTRISQSLEAGMLSEMLEAYIHELLDRRNAYVNLHRDISNWHMLAFIVSEKTCVISDLVAVPATLDR